MDTTKKKINKNIEYYLNLPWTYTIERAQENKKPIYIIRVNELPGIMTDALNVQEGMELIREAMKAVFELYLENGEEIPEPENIAEFKGNIAYRTSNVRHYLLAQQARMHKISLSQMIDQCVDATLKK